MKPDVIIVGGGIMGCTIAWRLAQRGVATTVLERSVPGAEASSAAAGILGPAVEATVANQALAIGIRSRELHASMAAELREDHGLDVGYRRCGVLRVAFDSAERADLLEHETKLTAAQIDCEALERDDVRHLEPSLSDNIVAGLHLPDEAQVDPKRLLPALAVAADHAGARFETGVTVRSIAVRDGRVLGVELDSGTLHAPTVVVAAGSWTTQIRGLNVRPDAVVPIRGQIVHTRTRPPITSRIVFGAGGYVVPRADGDVLCGSTEERAQFRREVTLGGLARIIRIATRLAPRLADAPILGSWSNFRPGTPDDAPLIGPTDIEGLILAAGHYRNGVLLAPITGELVADFITGSIDRETLEPFDPMRFRDQAP